jgi:hypothetical protein
MNPNDPDPEFQLILSHSSSLSGSYMSSFISEHSTCHPKDAELEGELKNKAEEAGGYFKTQTVTTTGDGASTTYIKKWPGDWSTTVSDLMYAFGSIGALAVFARNTIGSLKDWRELTAGREVKLVFRGQQLTVKQGQDISELIRRYENEQAEKPKGLPAPPDNKAS